jgi:nitrous oxidase accessory protein NosD
MIELSGISYTVNDNTVADGSGIIIGGWGNIVFNNTITNCSSGLNLGGYASNNIAYANKAINNTIGIKITTRGNNNILYANYVANNQYGVDNRYIYQLGNNTLFYHNNFVDNIEQVNIDTTFPYVGSEQWTAYHSGVFDNDSEGNYWSNYNGTDNNDDGIGDTPFVIDENRQDNYPLMEPFVLSGYYIHEEVPEFPAWLILPILLSVATVAFFYKQKLSKTPNWR